MNITHSLNEALEMLQAFIADETTTESIGRAAQLCAQSIASGGKIICCGNGGSLCDATHLAEELTGRFRNDRRPLPAISINDPAYLTCTANDYTFDDVFSRYVEAVGRQGDVLIAISTSGRSRNVLRAVEAARKQGVQVVALTSRSGQPLVEKSDVAVCAPSAPHADRIQEIHIKVIHILIEAIESLLDT
jgi:D-sedoheptulose 7-phosphate isomerase